MSSRISLFALGVKLLEENGDYFVRARARIID